MLRRVRPEVPRPPWFSFWLGGLTALVVGLPLSFLAAHLLRPRGPDHESMRTAMLVTGALCTLPLLFVGGGVARWVSDGLHLRRRHLLLKAAGQLAGAGALLGLIVGVAFGVPEHPLAWLPRILLGAAAAAPAGLCVALVTQWRVQRMPVPTPPAPPSGASLKA